MLLVIHGHRAVTSLLCNIYAYISLCHFQEHVRHESVQCKCDAHVGNRGIGNRKLYSCYHLLLGTATEVTLTTK